MPRTGLAGRCWWAGAGAGAGFGKSALKADARRCSMMKFTIVCERDDRSFMRVAAMCRRDSPSCTASWPHSGRAMK
jgi:hypothetical protein